MLVGDVNNNSYGGNVMSDRYIPKVGEVMMHESIKKVTGIKELVELRKKNAELEKENLKSLGWIATAMMRGLNVIDCSDELLKIIAKRDLEQQAKALHDYSKELFEDSKKIPIGAEHKGRGSSIYNWQMHHAKNLRWRGNKILNIKAKVGDL